LSEKPSSAPKIKPAGSKKGWDMGVSEIEEIKIEIYENIGGPFDYDEPCWGCHEFILVAKSNGDQITIAYDSI
jgi:hypothetical protein